MTENRSTHGSAHPTAPAPSTAVTAPTPTAVATSAPATGSWGSEGAFKSDLLIPRLQLVQEKAKVLKIGKMKIGDIIHSTTLEVMASTGQKIEVIPFSTFNTWSISEVMRKGDKVQKNWLRQERMDAKNEHFARKDFENGVEIERVRCLNFFVLLPKMIDDFPFLITFKNSNTNAGKRLSTHFQRSQMRSVPPAAQVFELSAHAESRNGFDFFALNVEPTRVTKPKELEVAYLWYQSVNKSNVKLASEDGEDAADEQVPF